MGYAIAPPPVSPLGPVGTIRHGDPIIFPQGTTVAHKAPTWALYVNAWLHKSWIGYALPGGTKIVPLGGVRHVTHDLSAMDRVITQLQATACAACDED